MNAPAVPAAVVPSGTSKGMRQLIAALIIFALLIVAIYYFVIRPAMFWAQVKVLVAQEAAAYGNKASEVEKLLLVGVRDIRSDSGLYGQAKAFAKSSGLPIERVLVDSALSMAKQLKYIN
ncbi:MAG TPA: hypothetical protein VEB40_01000 [Flavipsychrobacter sp.]|nr:hypothetical protein [Flavipsychrobacter sp.]